MFWMIKILSFRAAVGQAKLVRRPFSTPIKTNVVLSTRPLRLAVKYRVQQGEARRRERGENSMEEFAGLGDKCVMEHLFEPT